jgi:hypothetical protein
MNNKNTSEQGDGQADATVSLRVLVKFMYVAQVPPKEGKSLTFVSAVKYLIILPLSVFQFFTANVNQMVVFCIFTPCDMLIPTFRMTLKSHND